MADSSNIPKVENVEDAFRIAERHNISAIFLKMPEDISATYNKLVENADELEEKPDDFKEKLSFTYLIRRALEEHSEKRDELIALLGKYPYGGYTPKNTETTYLLSRNIPKEQKKRDAASKFGFVDFEDTPDSLLEVIKESNDEEIWEYFCKINEMIGVYNKEMRCIISSLTNSFYDRYGIDGELGADIFRVLTYKTTEVEEVAMGAHIDMTLYTMIANSHAQALHVLNCTDSGGWEQVVIPDGYWCVQMGWFVELLSKGAIPAMLHYVKSTCTPMYRVCAINFVDMPLDTELSFHSNLCVKEGISLEEAHRELTSGGRIGSTYPQIFKHWYSKITVGEAHEWVRKNLRSQM